MLKISVIMPVYNASQYILTCVDSLLTQELQEMEVILIDDRSTDGSLELVKSHIVGHRRESMFRFGQTTANLGPGAARNVGLQMAQGEYVAFMDSDDRAEPDMYEKLYDMACAFSADICACQAIQESASGKQILTNPIRQSGQFTIDDKRQFLIHYVAYLWTWIFRRKFLSNHQISFPSERSAEDSYFIACAALMAQSVAYISMPLYHYLVRKASLSKKTNDSRYLYKLSIGRKLIDFIKGRDVNFQEEVDFLYIKKSYLMAVLTYIENVVTPQKKVISSINAELLECVPNYRQNAYLRREVKLRVLVALLQRCPSLAVSILLILLKYLHIKD